MSSVHDRKSANQEGGELPELLRTVCVHWLVLAVVLYLQLNHCLLSKAVGRGIIITL